MYPNLSALESFEFVVQRFRQKLKRLSSLRVVTSNEVNGWLFYLNNRATRGDQFSQFFVDCRRHIPNHLSLVVINVVLQRVGVQKQGHYLAGHCAELHGFPRPSLCHSINFCILEWIAWI